MARIVPTQSGGHQVRWYDGKRNARGKLIETGGQVFDRKADAAAEKRRVEREQRVRREMKRAGAGRVLSLPAVLGLWKTSSEATGGTRSSFRAEKHRVLSQLVEARGWRTVADVTPAAIDAWRTERNGRGTDKPLQMLKTLLRYAGATLRQPIDLAALDVPARRRPEKQMPTLLTQPELDWILALAQVRGGDQALFILDHLATYGCRPVDACKLEVRDFDADAATLRLRDTKNGTTVVHPLLERHVERYRGLCRGRAEGDPLFLNPYGERWRIVSGKKREEQRAEQLTSWYWNNVSRHLHAGGQRGILCLKDHAISRMDALGIDDRTKALFTGHKTLGVFARYKGTNQQRARAALSLLG